MANLSVAEVSQIISQSADAAPEIANAVKVDRSAEKSAAQATQKVQNETKVSFKASLQKSGDKKEEESLTDKQKNALKEGFTGLDQVMNNFGKSISFAIFEQSGDLYAQVINTTTKEVIKTIPSEEMLALMARMHEALGMIVDRKG